MPDSKRLRLADRRLSLVDRPRASAWLLVLAVFGGLQGVALLLPESRLVAAFHDDAFYYYGVARNVAAEKGCTFDGLHATNGFHPLWMVALLPVFAVTQDDAGALRIILAIQIGLTALAAVAILRAYLGRLGAGAATAAIALVTLPASSSILAGGLESSLVLLILVATWIRLDRASGPEDSRPIRWLVIGCLCAAAFLARFEALVLTPCCLALGRRRLREDPRRAVALLAPSATAAIGFAVWSRAGFGTWLPISGLVKSEWAGRATPWRRLVKCLDVPWFGTDLMDGALVHAGVFPGETIYLTLHLVLLALLLAAGWRFRRTLIDAARSSLAQFILVAAVAWIVLDKAAGLDIEPWNRVPIHLCTAVLLGALVGARRRLAYLLNVVLFILAMVRIPWTAHTLGGAGTTYATYRHQAAEWLRQKTPEDARIGSWNAGLLGYFSHRAVVNLDGLVNDRRYFEDVVVGRDLDGYLRREGITYLADQACGLDPSLGPYLTRTANERLEKEFAVQAFFFNETAPDRCPGYAVWRRKENHTPVISP